MFTDDLGCVATVGTNGCGFEQQLDAVLKALSPSAATEWTIDGYVPPVFVEGTLGHADHANAGFVRAGSALAIILLTEEDDCSAADPDIFDPSSTTFAGTDLNLRCFVYPNASHPIERYVRGVDGHGGLLGLRRDPSRLIFAGIVGAPLDSVPSDGSTDYTAMLAHPAMQQVVDPAMPTRITPSCNVPGRGLAFPPRRIVRVAEGLEAGGARTTMQSICQGSYAAAIDAIALDIGDALGGTCLPRAQLTDSEGLVRCDLFEVLPSSAASTDCEILPGRTAAGTFEGRAVCAITQVGPAAGDAAGWYYEDEVAMIPGSDITAACAPGARQRVALASITAVDGADFVLACSEP